MPEISTSRYLVQAGWDDVPHLDEKVKTELLASTAPHLREARSKGIPSLGAGAIYPIQWEDVTVPPFAIPRHWKRGYALDVGWNRTAAMWGAVNPDDNVMYAYAEYYRGQAEPTIHATAIKARGDWIKGAIDPAARGRQPHDGRRLMVTYKGLGLNLVEAVNDVEAGLYQVWEDLSVGRFKFFSTLQNTAAEYRMYRRDEKGKVVKKFDHLMDCARYLRMTWHAIGAVQSPDSASVSSVRVGDKRAGY